MASQMPDSTSLEDDMSKLTIASPETRSEDFQPSVTGGVTSVPEPPTTDVSSAIDVTTTDPQEAKRLKAKEKKKRHEKERKARRKAEKKAEKTALVKYTGGHEQGNETDAATSSGGGLDASEDIHGQPRAWLRMLGIIVAPDGTREMVDDSLIDERVSLGYRFEGYVLEVEIHDFHGSGRLRFRF